MDFRPKRRSAVAGARTERRPILANPQPTKRPLSADPCIHDIEANLPELPPKDMITLLPILLLLPPTHQPTASQCPN